MPSSKATREYSHENITIKIPVMRVFLWVVTIFVVILSVMPSLYALVWAVAGSETVGVLEGKPSLYWFKHILADHEWRDSIAYSAIVAGLSSFIGAMLLLVHFYFMRYVRPFADRIAYVTILLVVLIPAVVYALALRILGGTLGISEIILLFTGHVILVLPLQFFVMESAQENIPSYLLFAGSTLGASHHKNIIFVYLPLMIDAIWSAFLVGIFFSFDELVIATFVLDSPLVTVPRRLWDQIHRSMDPSPAVISSLVAGVFILALVATQIVRRIQGRRELAL